MHAYIQMYTYTVIFCLISNMEQMVEIVDEHYA